MKLELYAVGFFGLLFIILFGAASSMIGSQELDGLCSIDGSYLFRTGGKWGCAQATPGFDVQVNMNSTGDLCATGPYESCQAGRLVDGSITFDAALVDDATLILCAYHLPEHPENLGVLYNSQINPGWNYTIMSTNPLDDNIIGCRLVHLS